MTHLKKSYKNCYFCSVCLKFKTEKFTQFGVLGLGGFFPRIRYITPATFSKSILLSHLQAEVIFEKTNANKLKRKKLYCLFGFGLENLEILDFLFILCEYFLRSLLI